MIRTITRAYTRHYRDNDQRTAYVEWRDHKGRTGRTEGRRESLHMRALLARALAEGLTIDKEEW